jgi:hypothetical protein
MGWTSIGELGLRAAKELKEAVWTHRLPSPLTRMGSDSSLLLCPYGRFGEPAAKGRVVWHDGQLQLNYDKAAIARTDKTMVSGPT